MINTSQIETIHHLHEVQLTDTSALKAVRKYKVANHVNAKKTLTYLTLKSDVYGGVIYVTYSFNMLKYKSVKPICYAYVDSSVILIYGGSEKFIKNQKIEDELNLFLAEKGVNLDADFTQEHPPIWRTRVCEKNEVITINEDFIDLAPCGYKISIGSKNEYTLIKSKK